MGQQRGAFGEVYRALGTKSGVTKCQLCGRGGLMAATVLEVYDEDGQPVGTKYACADCAVRVTSRAR
jgi:hypothetical protein